MLKRWSITEAPTKGDPHRYLLRVHAVLEDLRPLIRKFGPVCGRPKKDKLDPQYNLSLYLHGVTGPMLGRIETEVRSLTGAPAAGKPTPPAPPALAPKEKDLPQITVRARPPAPDLTPAPPAPLSVPGPAPAPVPMAAPEAPPPPALEGAPAGGGALFKALAAAPLCGACLDLDPVKTFESMAIGVFNRFAHASGHAVVENPGGMYNPLLIFGPPGSGKTHLLHAIGLQFQEQYLDQSILLSSGPRLSVAASLALEARRLPEMEEAFSKAKVLLIDDIHLLDVTELNRDGLATLLEISLAAGHQIVATSILPPRLMGELEEALHFQFGAGYSVDLKLPSVEIQRDVISRALSGAGIEGTEVDRGTFQDRVLANFPELASWVRRLMTLNRLKVEAGQSAELSEVLLALFSQPAPAEPPAAEPPAGKEPCALLYPKGAQSSAQEAWRRLGAEAAKSGWTFPWAKALSKEYDQGPRLPFLLADRVLRAGVRAALLLGPEPGSHWFGREQELRHYTERILGSFSVALGWMPLAQPEPWAGLMAYLDMAAVLGGRRGAAL